MLIHLFLEFLHLIQALEILFFGCLLLLMMLEIFSMLLSESIVMGEIFMREWYQYFLNLKLITIHIQKQTITIYIARHEQTYFFLQKEEFRK